MSLRFSSVCEEYRDPCFGKKTWGMAIKTFIVVSIQAKLSSPNPAHLRVGEFRGERVILIGLLPCQTLGPDNCPDAARAAGYYRWLRPPDASITYPGIPLDGRSTPPGARLRLPLAQKSARASLVERSNSRDHNRKILGVGRAKPVGTSPVHSALPPQNLGVQHRAGFP